MESIDITITMDNERVKKKIMFEDFDIAVVTNVMNKSE